MRDGGICCGPDLPQIRASTGTPALGRRKAGRMAMRNHIYDVLKRN